MCETGEAERSLVVQGQCRGWTLLALEATGWIARGSWMVEESASVDVQADCTSTLATLKGESGSVQQGSERVLGPPPPQPRLSVAKMASSEGSQCTVNLYHAFLPSCSRHGGLRHVLLTFHALFQNGPAGLKSVADEAKSKALKRNEEAHIRHLLVALGVQESICSQQQRRR